MTTVHQNVDLHLNVPICKVATRPTAGGCVWEKDKAKRESPVDSGDELRQGEEGVRAPEKPGLTSRSRGKRTTLNRAQTVVGFAEFA